MAQGKDPKALAYILRRERNGWRAEVHSHDDPASAPSGFGDKREEAVANLNDQPRFQQLLAEYGRAAPELSDFTIDDASDKDMAANASRQYGHIPAGPQRSMEEPRSLEPRNIKPRRAKPKTEARAAKEPPEAHRVKPPLGGGQKR